MRPWMINSCWQNFSSLYKEVIASKEAPNDISRYHHITASLYFGISALEAFLNQEMRRYLTSHGKSDESIYEVLRKSSIKDKLKKWPKKILQKNVNLKDGTIDTILLFNKIRGDLTHPKTKGFEIYTPLESIEPELVQLSVAEYIIGFHECLSTPFPYWLSGWNYLNPGKGSHEIMLIHNQQFLFSLVELGFDVPAAIHGDEWQYKNMLDFEGYIRVLRMLEGCDSCEPKNEAFPFQPKLCKRWWEPEHHSSCGNVTEESIKKSIELDKF